VPLISICLIVSLPDMPLISNLHYLIVCPPSAQADGTPKAQNPAVARAC
jgi:hypothetical protein